MSYPKMDEKEKTEKKNKASKILRDAKNFLNDVNLDDNMTLQDFYIAINTTEHDYLEALGISDVKERFINNYSPQMILAWNANMDIQLVVDPYAVISYIASYMNKTDTQITPFLREALYNAAGKETKEKLRVLKDAYITHRQVGASEAAYKINPNMRLKDSNISCIFVVTGFPQKRSRFYKWVKDDDFEEEQEIVEDEFDDDEDLEEQALPPAKTVKIEGRPGEYIESISIIEKYKARPKHLEDMCLAQFATAYVHAPKIPKRVEFIEGCSTEFSDKKIFEEKDDSILVDSLMMVEEALEANEQRSERKGNPKEQKFYHFLPRYICLENDLGRMRLRANPSVLRIHSSKKKDDYEQHYSELLLFTNWREEEEEFHPGDKNKCIEEYNKRIEMIKWNKEAIYPGEGTIDLLENLDLDIQRPAHIYDMLDGEGQQQQEDDMAAGTVDDPKFESFGYLGNLAQGEREQFESCKYRIVKVPHEEEMKFKTLRLVPEQIDILRKIDDYCRDVVKSRKKLDHKVKPLRLIVCGGAGI